ncbi:MAG: glycoside hydrolase family 25 protein [Lachnospiraceae bacterium]|nr:glycoside hydrolase family 25 protein [Lachnospiraceae bacterium]
MEKRVRNLAIVAAISALLLIVLFVWRTNNPPAGSGGHGEGAAPVTEETDPYRAFLNDSTFFDNENKTGSVVISEEKDNSRRLYLKASSVFKDIRISVTDAEGEPVKGYSFFVEVDSLGEYKDLDRDGQIYIPDVSAGDYFVKLMPIEDFRVPEDPMRVYVSEQLEYVVLEDITQFILSEDEVDVSKEDTRTQEAAEDADETERTAKWEGTDAVFGIDVSVYQHDIDWEKVAAAGVDFAIIRCGYRGSTKGGLIEDSKFKQNIEGATKAGIKVGVYFFTQAVNEVEAVEEASMVAMLCRDYKLDYPVFIDVEGAGGNGRADSLDPGTRTDVVKAFCKTIESAGLYAGVYSGRWWYYNNLHDEELQDFVHWLAEYRANPLYTGRFSIWQYTSSGNIDGINTKVDLDLIWQN